jgi:hypothetical protein
VVKLLNFNHPTPQGAPLLRKGINILDSPKEILVKSSVLLPPKGEELGTKKV